MRIALVAAIALATPSCGPKVPQHSGYRFKKPWAKAKRIKFEGNEAEIEDKLSYPAQKRAKWYVFNLPSDGSLEVEIEAFATSSHRPFGLYIEVFDKNFRRLLTTAPAEFDPAAARKARAKAEQAKKTDDKAGGDDDDWEEFEEPDAEVAGDSLDQEEALRSGELELSRKLDKLHKGRYFVHVFVGGRMDAAEFTLIIRSSRGRAQYVSNFPADVPNLRTLPIVPAFDDAPLANCKSCSCGDALCKKTCPTKCTKKPSYCGRCSCRKRRCKRKCGKCRRGKPTVVKKQTKSGLTGSILRAEKRGTGTRLLINRGTKHGVAAGWKASVVAGGKTIRFEIKSVSSGSCRGVVPAPPDKVKGKTVRLSP